MTDHIISRQPDGLPDIDKLSKDRKDWLGVFGNTWAPAKFDGVACEACCFPEAAQKFGYAHGPGCRKQWRCTWCRALSHEPAPDELVICPECGAAGCATDEMRDDFARRWSRAAAALLT